MLYHSFVAHDQPTAVVHPTEAAFDFPALAITRARFDMATTQLRSFKLGARVHKLQDRIKVSLPRHVRRHRV
jgi:hypothetical protein